mmetsp:Transcript_1977/g.4885  ORF Transcript_1977/g.4885 Transcript_1977/m.4885 type:complete len:253 (-) Transcript_1977:1560-2318(-)
MVSHSVGHHLATASCGRPHPDKLLLQLPDLIGRFGRRAPPVAPLAPLHTIAPPLLLHLRLSLGGGGLVGGRGSIGRSRAIGGAGDSLDVDVDGGGLGNLDRHGEDAKSAVVGGRDGRGVGVAGQREGLPKLHAPFGRRRNRQLALSVRRGRDVGEGRVARVAGPRHKELDRRMRVEVLNLLVQCLHGRASNTDDLGVDCLATPLAVRRRRDEAGVRRLVREEVVEARERVEDHHARVVLVPGAESEDLPLRW